MTHYSQYTDFQLLDLLKSGNHAAYTEIFKRYNSLLYAHAYKRLRNKTESQDLVQEIFTSLWLKKESIEISSNLIGYLYTGLKNKILNLLSHKDVESEYIRSLSDYIKQEYAVTDYLIREKQLQELIDLEMAALPPRMREVFELSRKQFMSHKEIAHELGIAESTVTDHIKNALKILRPRIGLLLVILYHLQK